MQALHIIGEEHQSLAAVLHAIRFMLKEVAAGKLAADLKLFEAMVHYLDAYAEQRHHPKEDLLFEVLAQRTAQATDALAALAEQHRAAPKRIAALHEALARYQADPTQLAGFVHAFETYADFYRTHMMLEEEVVLPLARAALTPEDWAGVDAAFRRDFAPPRDGAQEDFSGLFSKLVRFAPSPIGLGAGPYPG